jgi:mevalonate kinase
MTLDHFFNEKKYSKKKITKKQKNKEQSMEEKTSTIDVNVVESNENIFFKRKIDETINPSRLQKNNLYKSRLEYLKEIILDEYPSIKTDVLAERLDIPTELAQRLLLDCKKN